MTIRREANSSLLPDAMRAPRALVFLSVEWSGPERVARSAFATAATELSSMHAHVGIDFFLLMEEAEPNLDWLSSLGMEPLGKVPRGAGTLVWLTDGQVASVEMGAANLTARDIVDKSLQLWSGNEG